MSVSILAKQLGLSLSTVYRALSKPEAVSSEVLESVHAAARALNLNVKKRSPRGRPSNSERREDGKARIALWFVGSDKEHAYRHVGLQIALLRAACAKIGFTYQLLFSSGADEIPPAIKAGEVDALILEGLIPSTRVFHAIGCMPTVWIMTRRSPDYPGDFVEPDNAANGRIAADYLADRGHRVVAYVTVEPDYPAFAQREASFLARCSERGMQTVRATALPQLKHLHLRPAPDEDVGKLLATEILGANPCPTGIYLPNELAVGPLYGGMRELGADPAKFDRIVGNYDSPDVPGSVWSAFHPRPAGINVNGRAIITVAVEIAAMRLRHKDLVGRIGIQISPFLVPPPER